MKKSMVAPAANRTFARRFARESAMPRALPGGG